MKHTCADATIRAIVSPRYGLRRLSLLASGSHFLRRPSPRVCATCYESVFLRYSQFKKMIPSHDGVQRALYCPALTDSHVRFCSYIRSYASSIPLALADDPASPSLFASTYNRIHFKPSGSFAYGTCEMVDVDIWTMRKYDWRGLSAVRSTSEGPQAVLPQRINN
jgi:hypothetical protein